MFDGWEPDPQRRRLNWESLNTSDSQSCLCAVTAPNSISERAWGAQPFVWHASVTQQGSVHSPAK